VRGIEPGADAVRYADPKTKNKILIDILKKGQFEPESFDAVTFFHVLDHLIEPMSFISTSKEYLKPGGMMLCITHDVRALPVKIMGEFSYIFDIEHTQLFSKKTLALMFEKNGLRPLEIFDVSNTYSLDYWLTTAPIPSKPNLVLKSMIRTLHMANTRITLKAGNIGIIAQKIR
jgi:2-polyprenyl-3-methyl-5-hydroxy-6-metoxy-1,4-benzoquinol methylase